MAVSILTWKLPNVLMGVKYNFYTCTKIAPRVLANCLVTPQLDITRGARRTCKPRAHYVKRNVDYNLTEEILTPESTEFLHRVIEDRYSLRDSQSPLKTAPLERQPWTLGTLRTGVLAMKIGVIPQWTKDGKRFTCTMLQVLDNHVINYIPPEQYSLSKGYGKTWVKNKYGCVVVGALSTDPLKFSKAYNDMFAASGLPPKRKLTRFIVTPNAAVEPGTPLKAGHFRVGDYVDCQAKTIGHGFQGVVKRWGFKGGPASHGNTKWHRRPGSIGGGGDKAAVWKGKKMPGHMGMEMRTLKGLKIFRINTKYNVLYVKGQNIPGPTHCYVRVFDSSLRHRRRERLEKDPLMPTYYPGDLEPLPEEIYDDELFQFTKPTITFTEE